MDPDECASLKKKILIHTYPLRETIVVTVRQYVGRTDYTELFSWGYTNSKGKFSKEIYQNGAYFVRKSALI